MSFRGSVFALLLLPLAACGSRSQESTTIRAYYDGALYAASYRELNGTGAANESFSILYESDLGLVGGGEFVSVLGDAGANPVWHEVQVSGNQCAPDSLCAVPRQLLSAAEILAAVGTRPDEVHLVTTTTRCSVLGLQPAR